MTRVKCSSCGKRPAVSLSAGKCEVCLYAEDQGWEKARAQEEAAKHEREREKARKR